MAPREEEACPCPGEGSQKRRAPRLVTIKHFGSCPKCSRAETARLEIDAPITCIAALPSGRLVAGDAIGRLHWLEIVD